MSPLCPLEERTLPQDWRLYRAPRLPVAIPYPADWEVDETLIACGRLVFRTPGSHDALVVNVIDAIHSEGDACDATFEASAALLVAALKTLVTDYRELAVERRAGALRIDYRGVIAIEGRGTLLCLRSATTICALNAFVPATIDPHHAAVMARMIALLHDAGAAG